MFKKEDALKRIKEQLGKSSPLSDRSISETLETLMPKDESSEIELDDFVNSYMPIFKTMEGNVRSDVSDRVKEAEKEFKKKFSKRDSKSEHEEDEEVDEQDDIVSLLREELNELKASLTELSSKRKASEIKDEAIGKVKKMYNDSIVEIAADGFDFSQEDAEKIFEEKAKRIASTLGHSPRDGGGTDDDEPDFSSYISEIKNKYNV